MLIVHSTGVQLYCDSTAKNAKEVAKVRKELLCDLCEYFAPFAVIFFRR